MSALAKRARMRRVALIGKHPRLTFSATYSAGNERHVSTFDTLPTLGDIVVAAREHSFKPVIVEDVCVTKTKPRPLLLLCRA